MSTSEDVTQNVGALYAALGEIFTDLHQLAYDFHRALTEAGWDLKGPDEYTYPRRRLSLPGDHAWLYADAALAGPPVEAPALFAALYVLFSPNEEQRKLGPPGRPELWFFAGRVQAPRLAAADVWTYLRREEEARFDRPLTLGGAPARYLYQDETQRWETVCLGLELGAIDGPQALRERAVRPLCAAVTR